RDPEGGSCRSARGGLCPRRDALGGDPDGAGLGGDRDHRRGHAGTRQGVGRDDGGHDADRQQSPGLAVAVRAAVHHGRRHRQRIHRGGRFALSRRPGRDRPGPVPDHRHDQCVVAPPGLARGQGAHGAGQTAARRGGGVSAMSWNRVRRKAVSGAVVGFCATSVVLALIPLGFILFFVIANGLPALSAAFFTQMPKPVGEPGGGMANAIAGTLILIGLSAAIAVPIGIVSGIYVSEYRKTSLASAVRFSADILNGVPSIVIGLFAYTMAVLPFQLFSAIAGGLALGIMMIPLIVRMTEELLNLVPPTLRDGALALGATRAKAVFTVILPAALPGILTGVLVALARIAGEAAPLLFTAFNN